ncbi:MAG: diacylglycerol O-acyltransferase, partial [Candidatus Azotimanducaceae bacterium]
MHAVTLSLLDGPARFEDIYKFYEARIHLVPRLRQRLAFVPFNLAHPKWVDALDFDLSNHIKSHPVPPNTTLQRAYELALELGEPLLDRSRPLWLNYVLENVEGKTVLVQMSHHAFVDGATLVAMSTVLTEPSADAA